MYYYNFFLIGELDLSAEARSLRNYRKTIMSAQVNMVKAAQWVQEKYMKTTRGGGGGGNNNERMFTKIKERTTQGGIRKKSNSYTSLSQLYGSNNARKDKMRNANNNLNELLPTTSRPTAGTPFRTIPPDISDPAVGHMQNVLRRRKTQRPNSAKPARPNVDVGGMLGQQQIKYNEENKETRRQRPSTAGQDRLPRSPHVKVTSTRKRSKSPEFKEQHQQQQHHQQQQQQQHSRKKRSPQRAVSAGRSRSNNYNKQHPLPRARRIRRDRHTLAVTTLRLGNDATSKNKNKRQMPMIRSHVLPEKSYERNERGTTMKTSHGHEHIQPGLSVISGSTSIGGGSMDSNGIHDTLILENYKRKLTPVINGFSHATFNDNRGLDPWERQ